MVGLATGKRAWKDRSPTSGSRARLRRHDVPPRHQGLHDRAAIPGERLRQARLRHQGRDLGRREARQGGPALHGEPRTNTNGAQFFVTDAAAPHLDKGYTIFGECQPESVVHDIANVDVVGEQPKDKVEIKKVSIERLTK